MLFNFELLTEDEIRHLAKICSGAGGRAAEELFRLRPSNPLYFVLYLETAAGGKAARERVIERVKDRNGLLLDAAEIYIERGDKNKAAELSGAALGIPGLDRDRYRRAAFILQAAGRYREALAAMTRAGDDPGDWKARNDRGVIYMFLGDNRSAERDFPGALVAAPASWEVRLNLAALRLRTGHPEEAGAIYRELLRLPTLPDEARSFIMAELVKQRNMPRR